MDSLPVIDTEILIGFFRYHPLLEADSLYCLKTLLCSYKAGQWLQANRLILKRIQELNLAHGGRVEELDRRTAISRVPWTTDPEYQVLFNTIPAKVPPRLLTQIVVPERVGVDCSDLPPEERILPLGENSEVYPGMP